MGHRSIRTTPDVYGHVLPATDQAMTEHLETLSARPPRDRRPMETFE
jgi:hypothetical protein